MKKMKVFAALAAAVTALNALCIPAAAVENGELSPEELRAMYLERIHKQYGPFYTLGTDVSAYEPGDITMDGKVNLKDCMRMQIAFCDFINDDESCLTEDQIALGNVVREPEAYDFPIDVFDAAAVLRYINIHDVLEEEITMEDAAEYVAKGRRASHAKK